MKSFSTKPLYRITALALFLCIGAYVMQFSGTAFSNNPEKWGQLGDYFGGLINPLAALLNVYVTIQIAKAVSDFGAQQTTQQLAAQEKLNEQQLQVQKELVKTQLLYEILRDFKADILKTHGKITIVLAENRPLDLKSAVQGAQEVMDGFIKYYEGLFSFPSGIARSIIVEYNKWLVQLVQGIYDKGAYED